jgi:hypothetical protein
MAQIEPGQNIRERVFEMVVKVCAIKNWPPHEVKKYPLDELCLWFNLTKGN